MWLSHRNVSNLCIHRVGHMIGSESVIGNIKVPKTGNPDMVGGRESRAGPSRFTLIFKEIGQCFSNIK